MKVLLTGASGQLGNELAKCVPCEVDLISVDLSELDITQARTVSRVMDAHQPDVVINAAAYTAVDAAEKDRELAFAVNAEGAGNVAYAACEQGARCIQISTDFVFDGEATRPYRPDDPTAPLCVYGESKLAGECAVLDACGDRGLVIRTSWLYSVHGNNFVKSMLNLMRERPELGVVADQVGAPTWAAGLARVVWEATMQEELSGILHWSDAGTASWHDFAVAVRDDGWDRGLIDERIPVAPLTTEQFPRPARRPAWSVLDSSETRARMTTRSMHWREALGFMLNEMTEYVYA